MRPSVLRPGLQRRLVLTLVSTVVAVAAVLGLGSYLLVKYSLERAAIAQAVSQTRFNLVLAHNLLPADSGPDDYDRLLEALAIRGDFESLIVTESDTFVSGPQVSPELVSPQLTGAVAAGRLAYESVQLGSSRAVLVGGQIGPQASLYSAFALDGEERTLTRLRNIMLGLALVLALLGSVVGAAVAGRIARPILSASEAAARMAGGELDVRLPPARGEFGVLSDSFNQMAANLSVKIEALTRAEARERRFVSDVAHELRTPVAALVGEASLLQAQLAELPAGVVPPDTRRAGELLNRDVARLRRLIADLLEVSRIDARAVEMHWEQLDLFDFVRRLVTAHRWAVEVRTRLPEWTQPTAQGPGGWWVVWTDRRLLERVLVNLVENAFVHGLPPVWIEIEGHENGGEAAVLVSVADSGPGLPEDQRGRVFQRFYKGDPSRSSPGSGLGLAIAWENARLLGGVLLLGAVSAGSRFIVRLPAGDGGRLQKNHSSPGSESTV